VPKSLIPNSESSPKTLGLPISEAQRWAKSGMPVPTEVARACLPEEAEPLLYAVSALFGCAWPLPIALLLCFRLSKHPGRADQPTSHDSTASGRFVLCSSINTKARLGSTTGAGSCAKTLPPTARLLSSALSSTQPSELFEQRQSSSERKQTSSGAVWKR